MDVVKTMQEVDGVHGTRWTDSRKGILQKVEDYRRECIKSVILPR